MSKQKLFVIMNVLSFLDIVRSMDSFFRLIQPDPPRYTPPDCRAAVVDFNHAHTYDMLRLARAEIQKLTDDLTEAKRLETAARDLVTDRDSELSQARDEAMKAQHTIAALMAGQKAYDEEREILDAELREERKQSDKMWGIASCSVGAVLLVIGYFMVAMEWMAKKELQGQMRGELDARMDIMNQPYPLVPVVPSAHANRLGVHEHPAVRDVFGMPKHWDVTAGEGFHVARITSDGRTPRTTRGTPTFSVTLDANEGDLEGAEGLPKVSEHTWVDATKSKPEELETPKERMVVIPSTLLVTPNVNTLDEDFVVSGGHLVEPEGSPRSSEDVRNQIAELCERLNV